MGSAFSIIGNFLKRSKKQVQIPGYYKKNVYTKSFMLYSKAFRGGCVKLKEARVVFERIRKNAEIDVRYHVLHHHKNRGFSLDEIYFLIRETKGKLSDNNKFPTSTKGSFFYECKDAAGRKVELGIIIENNIVVIHAYRRI